LSESNPESGHSNFEEGEKGRKLGAQWGREKTGVQYILQNNDNLGTKIFQSGNETALQDCGGVETSQFQRERNH